MNEQADNPKNYSEHRGGMISSKAACDVIRKLSDITEKDPFGSDAFYANKRIFATVWHNENKVNVRLTLELQRKFLETDGEAFSEIDNAWGRQGWTTVQLEFVDKGLFSDAVQAAWESSNIKSSRMTKTTSKAIPAKSNARNKKTKVKIARKVKKR